MKIRDQLTIFFSIVIITSIGFTGFFAIVTAEASVIDSELHDMTNMVKFKEKEIETLHSRASEDLVFAVKNPQFVEYFELPDTELGNIFDENEVMQFTPAQREIKENLDTWIFEFQSKFSVDETCLIDSTGQEHTRLTFKKIAPDDDLSSEESTAPFFEPSFMINKGEVHLQYPYVSPDSERWVFAYTTPIVKNDGSKPAFYHFEMPMTVFQELVNVDSGRMYVVDPDGFIVADSDDSSLANAKYNVEPETITSFDPREYFPSIKTVFASSDFNVFQEMITDNEGFGTYSKNGELNYIAYTQLPTFGWTLVYEKPSSLILTHDNNVSNLTTSIGLISLGVSGLGVLGVVVISSRITRPITDLISASEKVSNGNYENVLKKKSNDEVGKLTIQFNAMIYKIKHSHDSLNKLVSQRTAELEKSNHIIKRQLEKIKNIGKLKEEFATMVSHELKTPLTPIKFNIEMLSESGVIGTLNADQLKSVKEIEANATRLDNLISDILYAQKLDMNRMIFHKKKFNTRDLIERIAKKFLPLIQEKGIELEIKNSFAGDIFSDENRIQQIMENLIKNSIDFVPEKGGKISIEIQNSHDFVTFSVTDNGSGIPKGKQKHLFQKFYQVDTSQTRKHGGVGLGLVICKGFVEGLGGKISCESEEGKVTTFFFTIPNKQEIEVKA